VGWEGRVWEVKEDVTTSSWHGDVTRSSRHGDLFVSCSLTDPNRHKLSRKTRHDAIANSWCGDTLRVVRLLPT